MRRARRRSGTRSGSSGSDGSDNSFADDSGSDLEFDVPIMVSAPPSATKANVMERSAHSRRRRRLEKATSKCVLAASDGTQIRVSLPVASRSAYLRAALSSHFAEAAALCVKLPTLSAAAVAHCADYLTEDYLENGSFKPQRHGAASYVCRHQEVAFLFALPPEAAVELLHASHYLGIPTLCFLCCRFVADHIDNAALEEVLDGVPPDVAGHIRSLVEAKAVVATEERPGSDGGN